MRLALVKPLYCMPFCVISITGMIARSIDQYTKSRESGGATTRKHTHAVTGFYMKLGHSDQEARWHGYKNGAVTRSKHRFFVQMKRLEMRKLALAMSTHPRVVNDCALGMMSVSFWCLLWIACSFAAVQQKEDSFKMKNSTAHLCMITAPREHTYVLETSGAILALAQVEEAGLG